MKIEKDFADVDHEWAKAAEKRFRELHLPDSTIQEALESAAAELATVGDPASEHFGMATHWATQQVNDLAAIGDLYLTEPEEEKLSWHVQLVSVFMPVVAICMVMFTGTGTLPLAVLLMILLLAAVWATGERVSYFMEPQRPITARLIRAAVSLLPVAFGLAYMETPEQTTQMTNDVSASIGLEWLSITVPMWQWLTVMLTFFLVSFSRTQTVVIRWLNRLARKSDHTGRNEDTAGPQGHVEGKYRFSHDRKWLSYFRRIAHHRWNLPRHDTRALSGHLVDEATPASLAVTHGRPQDALAWVAPVYRETRAELPSFRSIVLAVMFWSWAVVQQMYAEKFTAQLLVVGVALVLTWRAVSDIRVARKYFAQQKYGGQTLVVDPAASILTRNRYWLGTDEVGQWGKQARTFLDLPFDESHECVAKVVAQCRADETDPIDLYGPGKEWAQSENRRRTGDATP